MEDKFTIVSWNLCLGLANKKDYVSEMIKKLGIDDCCLQEVEISNQYKRLLQICSDTMNFIS